MAEIAKSDLFFLITTVSVVVLTIIIAVLLVYLFIVIKDVKEVVRKVKVESNEMIDDIKDLRIRLKAESTAVSRASAVFGFFRKTFFAKRGSVRKSKED